MRGMSMLPFGFRLPMSKALSKISRCVVSSCESTTIARSCSCFARGETESAGACVKTAAGTARAIAQRTFLIAVSFLVLPLATQGDDRVHLPASPGCLFLLRPWRYDAVRARIGDRLPEVLM